MNYSSLQLENLERLVQECIYDPAVAGPQKGRSNRVQVNWTMVSQQMHRPVTQCQTMWEQLRTMKSLKGGLFTAQEDELIVNAISEQMAKTGKLEQGFWAMLGERLNRSSRRILERWELRLRKKCSRAPQNSLPGVVTDIAQQNAPTV